MKEREELKQELKLEIKAEQVGRPTTRTLRILHTFRALRSLCTLHLSSAPSTRNLCLLNLYTSCVLRRLGGGPKLFEPRSLVGHRGCCFPSLACAPAAWKAARRGGWRDLLGGTGE